MRTTRRAFLKTVGGGLLLLHLVPGCDDDPGPAPGQRVVDVELKVGWLRTQMGGLDVRLRSYNGTVPGPTLTIRPGDRLASRVVNELTHYDSSAWAGDHNVPHHLNTTNLHLHGLDVIPHLFDPVGTSDPLAAMIAIAPGESFSYVFDIPADQPAGMYWYHPHHHGSTAVQAVSGMAGAIIVEGGADAVPAVAAARDVHLVMSDIGLFESETEAGVYTYEPVQNAIWNSFGTLEGGNLVHIWDADATPPAFVNQPQLKGGFTTGDYAVRFYCANGVPFFREDHAPTGGNAPVGTALEPMVIEAQPGEVVRLRLLNACSDLVMPLVLTGLDLHLIALDGVGFDAPRTQRTQEPSAMGDAEAVWDGRVDYGTSATTLVLAPANRAELLIQAEAAGTYELVQVAHQGQQFLDASRKVIARVVVAGAPKPMELPATLPAPARVYPLITADEIIEDRTLEFTGAFPATQNPAVGIDFSLNDAQYVEEAINTTVTLGTAEAWTLGAAAHSGHNSEGHPFHIHVNPFEVKSSGGIAQPPGTLMDTLWISKNTESTVWMRFVEWTGKAVYHCHILPHEDTGMTANLLIVPA